ncbi:cysteine dioxygenase family protein [Engelhardtia mirabilis]|uniref:Cysteine dioxygenase n=1 Tax=Engelhardtia mirabilis TaxID=2528011 RepID=A0A518BGR5_9BACT|nr:Cysteine dioxygenase [Planctomycetes bacterium Pla133]QDV00504.1 Cysteine dioxygenase [Planctomycetes bacterium Pla86]
MDPELTRYFDRIAEIGAAHRSPRSTVRAVEEAMRELLARGFVLDQRVRAPDGARHGRHLLYEDPGSGIVVIVMAWPPGGDSLPHDHGTWGTVAVVEGALQVTTYDRLDDGCDPDRAELAPTCSLRAEQGAVTSVLPPHDEYHRIENPTDALTLSLHTYGRDIESCHTFDPESSVVVEVRPSYTTRPR